MAKGFLQENFIRIMFISVIIGGILFITNIYLKRTVCGRLITPQDKIEARKSRLKEFAWGLKSYKKQNGHYPSDLKAVNKYVISHGMWSGSTEYKISKDGQSYELRDTGLDKISGTNDDIILEGN